jgi:alkaline phosphatase
MKKLTALVTSILASSLLVSCSSTTETIETKPKNIIYLIGDGMGMAHLSGYRYYKNSSSEHVGLGDKQVPQTLFDKHFVGMASTLPEDNTLVTDSAASATALSSGEKTYNGAIALDNDKSHTLTLVEKAKELGMLTATVSTSQITHATPASFWAHNVSRKNQNEIANAAFDDRIDGKFKTDLLFGGGQSFLIRDDRNIVEQFKQSGWQYSDSLTDIEKIDSLPALGLFADVGLPYAIDNPELPNRLTVMTKKALQLLDKNNPNGFVVMIEGSQIDWCSHGNDIACAMKEMEDFELTLKAAIDFAKEDGNTLVVLTADHATGGLTLGANGPYKWLPNLVHQTKISMPKLSNKLFESNDIEKTWGEYVGFELPKDVLQQFQALQASKDKKGLYGLLLKTVNAASGTGWTTRGHTGSDVAVIAYGPNSELFFGHQDNTDLAKKLFSLLK